MIFFVTLEVLPLINYEVEENGTGGGVHSFFFRQVSVFLIKKLRLSARFKVTQIFILFPLDS